MTYIVSIRGVQGSGKSFICSQMKNNTNVECIDTDDVLSEAYDAMISSNIIRSVCVCTRHTDTACFHWIICVNL